MTDALLRTEVLSKSFGGLRAVADVSLSFPVGSLHAVIGPNGAGKTTLINMLSGDLKPTSGAIYLNDENIAGLRADRISQKGIGRSYQKTNILAEMTALENVRLAAQSRQTGLVGALTSATKRRDLIDQARAALDRVGLAANDDGRPASALSHGEQRQLEIAMTLATKPSALLLDEPLAGMGPEETERMVGLLKSLVPGHAVILVEHDMDVVFSVADQLTVMVNGQVLESGTPEVIRSSEAVREAYLGGEDDDV
ncbi:MAG: ABC transporter ATP-binding protein [Pseudomonadota bacterium]